MGRIDNNAKLAVAISRERALRSHLVPPSRFCFENTQTIYEYPMTFLIRRNFPHLKQLNEFIHMASQGGLIKQWRANSHIQTYYNKENMYVKITLDHLHGYLIICCILLIISFLTLLLEQCVHTRATMPNPYRFWIIVDMLIDSDRHFWLENKRT